MQLRKREEENESERASEREGEARIVIRKNWQFDKTILVHIYCIVYSERHLFVYPHKITITWNVSFHESSLSKFQFAKDNFLVCYEHKLIC